MWIGYGAGNRKPTRYPRPPAQSQSPKRWNRFGLDVNALVGRDDQLSNRTSRPVSALLSSASIISCDPPVTQRGLALDGVEDAGDGARRCCPTAWGPGAGHLHILRRVVDRLVELDRPELRPGFGAEQLGL